MQDVSEKGVVVVSSFRRTHRLLVLFVVFVLVISSNLIYPQMS